MFDDKKLWKERAGGRVKDLGRYLRYIFNGHLVIVLLFLIGAGAFYYQEWLKTLSADFPAELVIAILIGILLTYSPVYNFLLEADQVFLIPLENKLKGYFLRSGVISLTFQGYILLMVLAVLMPMYAHINSSGFRLFVPYLAVLLFVKTWNMAVNWRIHYFVQPSVYKWDMVVRYFMNAAFTYLLLKQANLLFLLLIVVVMAFYYRSFFVRTRNMGLKWDILIDGEEKRMASFYRLANMFTDVPQLKATVKRRKWLDILINRIAFTKDKTYLYLYSRAFLRSSDYLGLFIRLTVIGALGIYFISFGLGQMVLSVLFLYLTGFQLLPLWNHHQNKLWVDLYPVAPKSKIAAFHKLMMIILLIQTAIFALFILIKGEMMIALLVLLAGAVFSYLFVYLYSKKRLKV
ncbi:ABC transporter permease [Neobacillus vireti]|uniref:ABC transporter, permease protein EscB n=1 Tax=Neobacillus vireti LMG 21834 TaxID=1131730 RepID=A0AB94IRJ7_9BACI|nr:ABC transporter permease [Neobacillus vireti]ETI69627.1 ABC transporter, permease protein EscB [Neobacillus vireti LMG 21834]KLT19182.1 ABC transporter permease [Neobacillus vireti]